MQIERRALYNLLRMNWLNDTGIKVEPWQVEDYRHTPLTQIFARLAEFEVQLDQHTFLSYAENFDTPEDLTEGLTDTEDAKLQDQIYLLIFELWRRLAFHKPSLSIFCDELDQQIALYDQGCHEVAESIQDSLGNLQDILEDNTDKGSEDPQTIFQSLAEGCANDIESFLYDVIADQIDNNNYNYASELIDGFYEYIPNEKSFAFLRARIVALTDPAQANTMMWEILQEDTGSISIDLLFDFLCFEVQSAEEDLFVATVKIVIPQIENEEDFQDLLNVAIDYYDVLDMDQQEQAVLKILEGRSGKDLRGEISSSDAAIVAFLKIMKLSCSQS